MTTTAETPEKTQVRKARGPRRTENRRTKVEQLTRDAEVLRLKREGLTHDQIAERIGYANAGGVSKALDRALRQAVQPDADAIRAKHAAFLVTAYAEVTALIARPAPVFVIPEGMDAEEGARWIERVRKAIGDQDQLVMQAIDRLVRLMERESKLFGADAPVRQEITGGAPSVVVFADALRFPAVDAPKVIDG